MVVLPTEKRFDWQYAPVMLIAIVLLNVLIFFLYQSNDAAKMEQALTLYAESGLLKNEWPAYQAYLTQDGDSEQLSDARELYKAQDIYPLAYAITADSGFTDYLHTYPDSLTFDVYSIDDNAQSWRWRRNDVMATIDTISSNRFGLKPNELSVITLISHQFMHGDFMHLLGNMFFLVICGFAVEAAIGPRYFLLLYLVSGVCGGLLFAVIDLHSDIPLVGASGAISGVMAMYLSIFRLQKIEFFYWIFIFAGYFRAPALLILPLYIGNELAQYFLDSNSNVAFMAHAGGFITGGALTYLLQKYRPRTVDIAYVETNQASDPERDAKAILYQRIDGIQFASAVKQLDAIDAQFGLDFNLALLRFNLLRAIGSDDCPAGFASLMHMKARGNSEQQDLAKAWAENDTLHSSVDDSQKIKLALIFSSEKHIAMAEHIFDACYNPEVANNDLGILARKLSMVFDKRGNKTKHDFYSAIADKAITRTV